MLKILMPPVPQLPTNDAGSNNGCVVGDGGASNIDVGDVDGAVSGV